MGIPEAFGVRDEMIEAYRQRLEIELGLWNNRPAYDLTACPDGSGKKIIWCYGTQVGHTAPRGRYGYLRETNASGHAIDESFAYLLTRPDDGGPLRHGDKPFSR